MQWLVDLGIEWVRRYHRLDVTTTDVGDGPVLFVANHGFGAMCDLNVVATMAAIRVLELDRPLTILTHQMAWTLGVGKLFEPIGIVPAGREHAFDAFSRGHNVLVFPGGDIDAFKSWWDKDRVVFAGRRGYARLATEIGVPIVPIVTSGAGNTLFSLSDGQAIARFLRLDKTLRLKTVPVTVSIPWGFNIGIVGFLPYVPLPVQLRTTVLAPIHQSDPDVLASQVEAAMQAALDDLRR